MEFLKAFLNLTWLHSCAASVRLCWSYPGCFHQPFEFDILVQFIIECFQFLFFSFWVCVSAPQPPSVLCLTVRCSKVPYFLFYLWSRCSTFSWVTCGFPCPWMPRRGIECFICVLRCCAFNSDFGLSASQSTSNRFEVNICSKFGNLLHSNHLPLKFHESKPNAAWSYWATVLVAVRWSRQLSSFDPTIWAVLLLPLLSLKTVFLHLHVFINRMGP